MTYRFNFDAGYHAIESMAAASNKISQLLEDQRASVAQYLDQWDSDTRTQYEAARQEWEEKARRMPLTLEAARGGLSNIHDIYQGQEQRGTATWAAQ
jgi:WXG100 family type VII secretion target